jgi:hypothetical protein
LQTFVGTIWSQILKHSIFREEATKTRRNIDEHVEIGESVAEDADLPLQVKNTIIGTNPNIFTLDTIDTLQKPSDVPASILNKPMKLPNYTNQSTPNSKDSACFLIVNNGSIP